MAFSLLPIAVAREFERVSKLSFVGGFALRISPKKGGNLLTCVKFSSSSTRRDFSAVAEDLTKKNGYMHLREMGLPKKWSPIWRDITDNGEIFEGSENGSPRGASMWKGCVPVRVRNRVALGAGR